MNWLTSFLPVHTTQALGWTLIHSLWQAGLAALLVAAVFALLPRLSAETRALLSYGGVILIVLMAGLTFTGQLGGAPLTPASTTLAASAGTGIGPVDVTPLSSGGLNVSGLRLLFMSWIPALTGLWFLGVAIALGRLGGGVWQLRRLRREKHQKVPEHLVRKLNALKYRFKLSRPVRLLAGKRLTTPIVYGHLRPVILFPLALLASVSPEQIEALLAHELAHIKRHDYLLNLFLRLFRTLLFFNPGFLWLAKAWENEREYCCDQMATEAGVKPVCLAEALLGVRERQLALLALTPAALGHGSLRQRIRRIFGEPVRTQVRFGVGLPAMLVLMMAGLWLLGTPRGVTASEFFHGLGDTARQSTPTPKAEKTPVVWSVKSDDEWKRQVEKLEILRQKMDLLRREKPSARRDADLTRLEKEFVSLAKVLVAGVPPPLPAPAAQVAPVAPVSPVTPLPEIAPVAAIRSTEPIAPPALPELAEPVEPAAPPSLPEPAEVAHKIQELKRIQEELELKVLAEHEKNLKETQAGNFEQQQRLKAELKVLEEKQKKVLEAEKAEMELHQQRLSVEQREQEEKLRLEEKKLAARMKVEQKRMAEEQRLQQVELAAIEKRLKEEEKVIKHFENELETYLRSQGLIGKADKMNVEIRQKKVLLAGQELSEIHSSAVRELVRKILGSVLDDSDRRIVIQR